MLWLPSPNVAIATQRLFLLLSLVAKRREPHTWHALLTANVACHAPTVGSTKPHRSPGSPPPHVYAVKASAMPGA